MPEFNRRFGAVSFPITDNESLDRGQKTLLDVVRKAIESDFAAVWPTRSRQTPLAKAKSPVESVYLIEPTNEAIRQLKPAFPALFVYPDGEATNSSFTISKNAVTRTWGVEWILGPLDAEQSARLRPLLNAVPLLVAEICRVGGHPAFGMDANNAHPDQALFESDGGGFSELKVTGSITGAASIEGESPLYWATRVTVESLEISGLASNTYGTVPHVGADFSFTEDSDEDGPEDDEMTVDTESELT